MSLLDSYVAAHTKVHWNTDKEKEKSVRDRQRIASDFNSGHSLARILDTHKSEPKYQRIKGEKEWGVMTFTKPVGRTMRCERPCVDDSILWLDRQTKEAIGITYRKETFCNQMEMYWGDDDGEESE